MVAGALSQRGWENQDGEKRSKVEIVADEVAPSLRWASADIRRNEFKAAVVRRRVAAWPFRAERGTSGLRHGRGALLARAGRPATNERELKKERTMAKVKKRGKPGQKNNDRGRKKKVSVLSSEKIEYVDWKDVNLLRRFVSERSKIRARRVNGNSTQQQKLVADAVKVAREMALIPTPPASPPSATTAGATAVIVVAVRVPRARPHVQAVAAAPMGTPATRSSPTRRPSPRSRVSR